jgi:protein MpaA
MENRRHGRRRFSLLIVPLLAAGCATQSPEVRMTDPAAPPAMIMPAPPPTPATAVRTLGKTVEGRALTLHLFEDSARKPGETVLILGGIHGNEGTSAGVCRELLAWLPQHPELWRDRRIAIVAEANPDGLARRLRTNANLVDLNRNFPAQNWKKTRRSSFFGGEAPASQPETKLLIALIEELRPSRIVSIHSMDDPCNNYDGPGGTLARAMAACNGYPVKASIGYPTPGSFGSWAGGDRGIPVITLELPNRAPTAKSWEKNRDALVAFIRTNVASVAQTAKPAIMEQSLPEPTGSVGK